MGIKIDWIAHKHPLDLISTIEWHPGYEFLFFPKKLKFLFMCYFFDSEKQF